MTTPHQNCADALLLLSTVLAPLEVLLEQDPLVRHQGDPSRLGYLVISSSISSAFRDLKRSNAELDRSYETLVGALLVAEHQGLGKLEELNHDLGFKGATGARFVGPNIFITIENCLEHTHHERFAIEIRISNKG